MTIQYLKQRANYFQQGGQIYDNNGQYIPLDNVPSLPQPYVNLYGQNKFNDHVYCLSPFNPNKRLSFSNVTNLPRYDYDTNIVKQILGPSPRQSLESINPQYLKPNEIINESYDDKENYYDVQNIQYTNGRKSLNYNLKERDPYLQNTQPIRNNFSSNSSSNSNTSYGSGETYFSFRKQEQQEYFMSPEAKQQKLNYPDPNFSNQVLYRVIQNRNCVPHINTPIKSTRNSNITENVPYFLQERKITCLR